MSTAFSDFEPLTERRRIERQRQQRRRVMIATGSASIVLIIIVMGGAAVAYNASTQDNDGSSSPPSKVSPSGGGGGSGSNLISVSKSIKAMCAQTDYRDACEKSLTKSANGTASSPKSLVRAAVAAIGDAIAAAFDRSGLVVSDDPRVKAAVADCKEVYGHAKDDLARTLDGIDVSGMDGITRAGHQLRVWLSAVIAHQETCIDGFPDGDIKKKMTEAMENGKELTSNALAIIDKAASFLSMFAASSHRRRILSTSMSHDATALLEEERRQLKGFQNAPKPNVVVAKDGSGQFKTINDALKAMPKTYTGRYVIYVKEGVYEEYVTITKQMGNVTMYGDGAQKTVITGNRNFADGLTTFKTATFNALGDGFMAIALGFRNTAGAAKHQAVALLVQSDKSIFLNCRMDAFQDTLYAHSKSQFYRNCVISGTIDFVFGDAAAVFQNCVLVLRRPLDNQQNIATAQGRADGREATGFVFQACRFAAETALKDASRPAIRSYLARPWREFSRTVIMESEIPGFIDKAGYLPWNGEFGLKTLWYAEYANRGPGADTAGRVNWPGYKKVISKEEADKFTVQSFLQAEPWIKPTGTPVKYGFWA
ncbi:hypothetical protein QOZ80_8BG0661780 [Eleusine coracana subsp. coracana]|nr:hypothetical protein QOZ80_8BG0661780 [Eleusine coracana subsp. coracana]